MTRCRHGVMTARTPATDDMCDHQFVSLLCEKCADPGFPLCGKKIEMDFNTCSIYVGQPLGVVL
jgi:hypothetical protein